MADSPQTQHTDTSKQDSANKSIPFAVVEAYKTIRTNLNFSLPQRGCKSFVVSSANPSEGKSTTAINISISFSQLGKKVLLIDADMRRPSIHKKIKFMNTLGLYTVLAGTSTFDEAVQTVNPYFNVLTSGPLPPNPPELLASEALASLLDALEERYDYIILDTPPVNIVSDALSISAKVDGMLLVVRDGFTGRDDFQRTIDACNFANVHLLGAVMNGLDPKYNNRYYSYKRRHYYNYRYKYGRGYGYGYGYGNNGQSKK